MARPTEDDLDALELLLADDRLEEKSVDFLHDLSIALAEDEQELRETAWTDAQCEWFDNLTVKYL